MRTSMIERFLRSFAFSLMLCLLSAGLAILHVRKLVEGFDTTEALWLVYNATIALLFLTRTTPTVVDVNPLHWAIALLTSFSGFAFSSSVVATHAAMLPLAEGLIWLAIVLGIATALLLGRSYDFLPAVRGVQTRWLYKIIKHPMYLSSMAVELGYVLKHPSIYNWVLLAVVIVLYDRRARFEEQVMLHDASYVEYLHAVKCRFIPGIY